MTQPSHQQGDDKGKDYQKTKPTGQSFRMLPTAATKVAETRIADPPKDTADNSVAAESNRAHVTGPGDKRYKATYRSKEPAEEDAFSTVFKEK